MRYLRKHTDLEVAETDEEVMKVNNGVWPDDDLKNKVLVPQTTKEILTRESVIYFASFVPVNLIKIARKRGFKIVLLKIGIDELKRRNTQRMKEEGYQDAAPYLRLQLDTFERLNNKELIDIVIDGNQSVDLLVSKLAELC